MKENKTKKRYEVTAIMSTPCYLTVEAYDEEEAREIARETDGGDFMSDDNPYAGDWVIQHDVKCLDEE